MEKVIMWELEKGPLNKASSDNQHGCKSGYSTYSALSNVIGEIEHNISKKQFTLAVFLDISGAFNNVSFKRVIEGMKESGFPREVIRWYANYLYNRISIGKLGNQIIKRQLTKGVPQGGVASPVFWNIAFDELIKELIDEERPDSAGKIRFNRIFSSILHKAGKFVKKLVFLPYQSFTYFLTKLQRLEQSSLHTWN